MKISVIIRELENLAAPFYQESYDNAGLITGNPDWDCNGIICSLDATEDVVQEAIDNKCNCIIAHHPIVFSGLKKINGKNYVERTVIKAIKNDIAIYAIHTNLDNVIKGVSGRIADKLGLVNRQILSPKPGTLRKLFTFVPSEHMETVRKAVFEAGAGEIGNYKECSFSAEGSGTFKANGGANPYVGKVGERHYEAEHKFEVVFPAFLQGAVVRALVKVHPYEEVAYDVVELSNSHPLVGSGLIGELAEGIAPKDFLSLLKEQFGLTVIRHTALLERPVKKVALCGGAGSFLLKTAVAAGADVYITGDVKYHEFFDAEGRLIFCDIGHYESEQFTIELLHDILVEKFPTFAVLKTKVKTNPVHYFLG
jgi:dinuclear metal center YbgI/SA1388 family protein